MKASSYGLRVLSVALALTAVFAVREAFSMAAKTQEAQLPAEPDVAFLEPGSETNGAQSNATSLNTQGSTTNSINALPSRPARRSAASAAAAGRAAVSRWSVVARIWNAWAAFIVQR